MSGDGKREIFLAAVRGEKTSRPAVASVNQTATYEQMDELGVHMPEANMKGELMAKLALGAHTILGFDAVKAPFCQTIEQEALGCTINPGDKENLPSVVGHPYEKPQEQEPQFPEDFLERKRVPELIKAVKILKEEVGDSAAVIGGIIGPYSIAASLLGITNALKLVMKNPDSLIPFLEIATKAAGDLAKALINAGADVICIEDMMASVTMISPKSYKQVALPWQTELIGKIEVPTVLHICGKVDMIIPDMISTGVSGLSFEPQTDIPSAQRAVYEAGRNVGFIGGVNTMDHLYYGDPAMVRQAALDASEQGYHVIAPSCSIPPAATTEKLRAMLIY